MTEAGQLGPEDKQSQGEASGGQQRRRQRRQNGQPGPWGIGEIGGGGWGIV